MPMTRTRRPRAGTDRLTLGQSTRIVSCPTATPESVGSSSSSPSRAARRPRAYTRRATGRWRSSNTTRSASRPGATAPRSCSPKRSAALNVAMRTASAGSTPAAIALRTMPSIEPRSSRSGSVRSSVQKQSRDAVAGVISGISSSRLRAAVPSRMKIVMPRDSFSRASVAVVASWSESSPAAT